MIPYKLIIAVFSVLIMIAAFNSPVLGQEIEQLNINEATVQELAQLQEVGPKCAVRIIEHRQKYGLFKLTEELMEVPGIGPHTYERIKDQISAQ
ncbi:MAG: helix-hairpin-helix domain-containing protein [Desulfobacterales bacterium]|jgi:competence protein ComEA